MDTHTLVMFDKAFTCLPSVVRPLQALNLGLCRVVSSDKVQEEGMNLDQVDSIGITFKWGICYVVVQEVVIDHQRFR
jgi:hypothetical protein